MRKEVISYIALVLISCGKDEGEKKEQIPECNLQASTCNFGDKGCGKVFSSESDSINIDLKELKGTFIISPYAIGDTQDVKGGDSKNLLNFEQSLTLFGKSNPVYIDKNHYGITEVEERRKYILQLLRSRLSEESFSTKEYQNLIGQYETFVKNTDIRAKLADALIRQKKTIRQLSMLADGCNLTSIELSEDTYDIQPIKAPSSAYCIYQAEDNNADASILKTAADQMIANYKEIFKDNFKDVGSYKFRPNFVFIHPDDGYTETFGVFEQGASDSVGSPVIVLPAISSRTGQQRIGTIAHELLHSLVHYFKAKRNGLKKLETVAIEEGLAHFFQDVFGDGISNYEDYVTLFMKSWTQSSKGDVVLGVNADTNALRGAASSFIYYLAGRLGSFEVRDGYIGGSAVKCIAKYIKSKNVETSGLDNFLGKKLHRVFGEFGASLVVAGSEAESDDKIYTFNPKIENVDLLGKSSIFGFTPNDKDREVSKITNYMAWFTPAENADYEVPYYTFRPTILEGGKSIRFNLPISGLGGFGVRIK